MSYLRRFPLDTIKLDRSFVSGLGTDEPDLPILQAVVSLAHGLGVHVVAEGIETPGHQASLRETACDRGHGYSFARPLPPDDLRALLMATGDERLVLPLT